MEVHPRHSQADFCASTKAAHEKYEGTVIKKMKNLHDGH